MIDLNGESSDWGRMKGLVLFDFSNHQYLSSLLLKNDILANSEFTDFLEYIFFNWYRNEFGSFWLYESDIFFWGSSNSEARKIQISNDDVSSRVVTGGFLHRNNSYLKKMYGESLVINDLDYRFEISLPRDTIITQNLSEDNFSNVIKLKTPYSEIEIRFELLAKIDINYDNDELSKKLFDYYSLNHESKMRHIRSRIHLRQNINPQYKYSKSAKQEVEWFDLLSKKLSRDFSWQNRKKELKQAFKLN